MSADLFHRASGCTWGNLTLSIDRALGALLIGIWQDETRGLEVMVAPGAALDFAAKIAGAVNTLERERQLAAGGEAGHLLSKEG